MKFKTIMRFYYIPVVMAKSRAMARPNADKNVGDQRFSPTIGKASLEDNLLVPLKHEHTPVVYSHYLVISQRMWGLFPHKCLHKNLWGFYSELSELEMKMLLTRWLNKQASGAVQCSTAEYCKERRHQVIWRSGEVHLSNEEPPGSISLSQFPDCEIPLLLLLLSKVLSSWNSHRSMIFLILLPDWGEKKPKTLYGLLDILLVCFTGPWNSKGLPPLS